MSFEFWLHVAAYIVFFGLGFWLSMFLFTREGPESSRVIYLSNDENTEIHRALDYFEQQGTNGLPDDQNYPSVYVLSGNTVYLCKESKDSPITIDWYGRGGGR